KSAARARLDGARGLAGPSGGRAPEYSYKFAIFDGTSGAKGWPVPRGAVPESGSTGRCHVVKRTTRAPGPPRRAAKLPALCLEAIPECLQDRPFEGPADRLGTCLQGGQIAALAIGPWARTHGQVVHPAEDHRAICDLNAAPVGDLGDPWAVLS